MNNDDDKLLIKFQFDCGDCGRSGNLEGIFVCTRAERKKIIGKEVYFGEVLGKHSEICGTILAKEMNIVTDDQEFITKMQEVLKFKTTLSGYNPFDFDLLEADKDE